MGTTIAYRVILEPEAGSNMTSGAKAKMPSGIPTTCFLRVGAPMAFLAQRTEKTHPDTHESGSPRLDAPRLWRLAADPDARLNAATSLAEPQHTWPVA